MDPAQLTSLTALGAAVIGASAVLCGQLMYARHADRVAAEDRIKLAVEDVLVKSLTISVRSHELTTLGAEMASLAGQAARLLGTVTPIDYQRLFAPMNDAAEDLNRAASQVWMSADEKTVACVAELATATAEIIAAHQHRLGHGPWAVVRRAFTGQLLAKPDTLHAAESRLAKARSSLVDQARKSWGLEPISFVDLQ